MLPKRVPGQQPGIAGSGERAPAERPAGPHDATVRLYRPGTRQRTSSRQRHRWRGSRPHRQLSSTRAQRQLSSRQRRRLTSSRPRLRQKRTSSRPRARLARRQRTQQRMTSRTGCPPSAEPGARRSRRRAMTGRTIKTNADAFGPSSRPSGCDIHSRNPRWMSHPVAAAHDGRQQNSPRQARCGKSRWPTPGPLRQALSWAG